MKPRSAKPPRAAKPWTGFRQLSHANYHRDPCPQPSLSSSIAHTLVSKSPMHAYLTHPRLGGQPPEPTLEMDKGTIAHELLLRPRGHGRIAVIDAENYRTKDAQEARDEARAVGKVPVLPHQLDAVKDAVAAIREQLRAFGIALNGESELAGFWVEHADDGTPVQCRMQLDHFLLQPGVIYDLKVGASAHPRACQKHMITFGNHVQGAAYKRGVGAIVPELLGRVEFLNLFCEVEPPYCVTPVEHAGSMRDLGDRIWRRAVNTWAKCLKEQRWPGYVSAVTSIEAPPYALLDELTEETAA